MHKRTVAMGALSALFLVGFLSAAAGETSAPAPKAATRPAGVPAEAAVWMVVPSPKATLDRLKKLVDAFQPGAGAMVEMLIRQGSPWNFEEADDAKPLVAVGELPKKEGEKPLWAAVGSLKAGADAAAALEKRFGGKPAKTEEGLSVFMQVQEGNLPDKEVYTLAKDGRVTVGDSKALVKLLAGCPAPAEGAYPAGADLLGGVDVKALAAQYKDKIEAGLKEFENEMQAGLPGMDEATAKQVQAFAKIMTDWVRAALQEVETVSWQVKLGDTVSLGWNARAAAGSAFAGWLADAEKLQLPSTKELPEGGVFSMAAALPAERLAALAATCTKAFCEAAGGDEPSKKAAEEMAAAVVAYMKAADGRMTMAMLRRGGGLAAAGSCGLKDPVAARAQLLKALKLLESGPLAEAMAKTGAKYALKEKVRQAGGLDVDRLSMEIKPPANANVPAEMQEMQKKLVEKMFGQPMLEDLAFTKDRCLLAFGKEAEPILDDLAARASGAKPGTEALAATLKAAPKGSFLAGELYVIEYAKLTLDLMADAMGGMLPIPKLNLPKDAEKTPVTGYLWAAGGELGAELRVPVEPIKKLVEAIKKMQQDMIQGMQNQPVVPLPAE